MTAIVVIAASEGALEPLQAITAALPHGCAASIFIVWHIGDHPSVLPDVLTRAGNLYAAFANNNERTQGGRIYIAPPDCHMRVAPGVVLLDHGPKVHHTRPAADPLFISAAHAYHAEVVGVILSGGDGDGADGLRIVKEHGGLALVQSPVVAKNPSMPIAAFAKDHPDASMTTAELARAVAAFCSAH